MRQWTSLLAQRNLVARLNANLFAALPHCLTLEAFGLSFRCVECHVGSGTYKKGDKRDWHSHAEYQLEIPLAGAFFFEAASGKKVLLTPGKALLIPMQLAHRWECRKACPILGISLDLISLTRKTVTTRLVTDDMEVVSFPPLRAKTEEFIQDALAETHAVAKAKLVASRLFLLLGDIFEHVPERQDSKMTVRSRSRGNIRSQESVGKVVAYLEAHYAERIRLQRVIQDLGMSDRHLHRLFLQYVGRSAHDYLLDLRLEHARQLLMEQGRNYLIKEIAFRCGFSSAAYFISSFGKAFGISPLAYRANHGGGRQIFSLYMRSDRKEARAWPKGRPGGPAPRKKKAS